MRMNRMWIFIVISTIALAGAGLAMAQSIGGVPTDVHLWFTTTASLAAVVAALVALVRRVVDASGVGSCIRWLSTWVSIQ